MLYVFVAISVLDKKLSLPSALSNALAIAFIPLQFLTMFSALHILYFVSKSLLIAERGRPVTFNEHAGAFFLIGFLLVGVWTTQPRINRLAQHQVKSP
jgi:hypothetical protein